MGRFVVVVVLGLAACGETEPQVVGLRELCTRIAQPFHDAWSACDPPAMADYEIANECLEVYEDCGHSSDAVEGCIVELLAASEDCSGYAAARTLCANVGHTCVRGSAPEPW